MLWVLSCHQQQFFFFFVIFHCATFFHKFCFPYTLLVEKNIMFLFFVFFFSFCTDTTDSLLHFSTSCCCFSNISKIKREQEKLVWSQSLRGSYSWWPVEENWEMHQHPQSQMEAAAHCVSQSLARIIKLIWWFTDQVYDFICFSYTHLGFFLQVFMHANSLEYLRIAVLLDEFAIAWRSKELS